MKPVSVLVLALLFSSSLYAHDYGNFGMCVYKHFPNSSKEEQIYKYISVEENSQCMNYDGEHAKFTVKIPPNTKPGLYCDDDRVKFENRWGGCLVHRSYIGFEFSANGGGIHATTSGKLRFYAPADHNEVWFQGHVNKSLHLCKGRHRCDDDHVYEFHNGDIIYIVYDGDQ